jgi:hypothetical protein
MGKLKLRLQKFSIRKNFKKKGINLKWYQLVKLKRRLLKNDWWKIKRNRKLA